MEPVSRRIMTHDSLFMARLRLALTGVRTVLSIANILVLTVDFLVDQSSGLTQKNGFRRSFLLKDIAIN